MDALQAAKVCDKLRLGALISDPEEVKGGLVHRMWRIRTSEGMFAVKQLSPERLRMPGARHRHRVTEQIAEVFADHGLPAVPALANGQDYVHDIDGVTLLAYPWIEGVMLSLNAANPEQCWQIGFVLGRMHALQLRIPELDFTYAFPYPSFSDEHWVQLARQADEIGMPWADVAAHSLPELIKYNTEYSRESEQLAKITVVSHRDLDQKNTLWSGPLSFAIIDWEAAGAINPTMDLLAVALNWSGLRAGQCQREAFESVIRGYRSAGYAIHTPMRIALSGCIGKWLNWLEYNFQRSLDVYADQEEMLRLALAEINVTLTTLQLLDRHREEWNDWFDASLSCW
jgi:Ser/Thr protein kinase RdoA (MazF antagonist)